MTFAPARRGFVAGSLALAGCASLPPAPAGVAVDPPPLWGALVPGPYPVGLSVQWVSNPNLPGWGGAPDRQIQEWHWFPARPGTGRAATVADFGRLFVEPASTTLPAGWPTRFEAALETGYDPPLPPGGYDRLAPFAVASRIAAAPTRDRFPLVVLGQGYAFESPFHQHVLAEYLASHGYRVVTAPLTGAAEFKVGLDADDFAAAVNDLGFLLHRHRGRYPVALVGADLGGMATYALAAEDVGVNLVVGMDSGTLSRELIDRLLLTRPTFGFDRVRAPYVHVTRSAAENAARNLAEDLRALETGGGRLRTMVRIPGMRHADFFSAAAIENVAPNFWGEVQGNPATSYAVLLEVVRRAADHFLKREGAWPPAVASPVTVETWPAT